MSILYAVGRQESQFAYFQFGVGGNHVAHRGRIGHGHQVQFRNMWVAAKTHAIIYNAIRRQVDDRQLHTFLEVGVPAGVDIHRAFGNVFHMERVTASDGAGFRGGLALSEGPGMYPRRSN